jgi:hypothetical protein
MFIPIGYGRALPDARSACAVSLSPGRSILGKVSFADVESAELRKISLPLKIAVWVKRSETQLTGYDFANVPGSNPNASS